MQDAGTEQAGPSRRRLRLPTGVRSRILTAVLLITAAGMIFAGGLSYLLTRESTEDQISAQLSQEVSEFRQAVKIAEDPANRVPVTSDRDLLAYAIKATIPDRDEAVVGLVDGKVVLVAANETPLQRSVPADAELIAAAAAVGIDEPMRIRTITTATHHNLAFASVPVRVEGAPSVGHYLVVIDVDQAFVATHRIYLTYAAICLITLVLVAVVGNIVAGRLLLPLRTLQQTAQKITDENLSGRIPAHQLAGDDEIAGVGRTMNAMLDRLSGSFDQQRQLLDDAGHELRTPITIIRGHLELIDPEDPHDVLETRDLAVDELDRMHRMVDDLLVLAKARRPDFVRPAAVPLQGLLAQVIDKVRPLAARDWRSEAAVGDIVVAVDEQRVTQALVQLVANAIRFTERGTVIAIGAQLAAGARGGQVLRLHVRDEGTGITPDQQQVIFERFHRGTARVDDHPDGAGLGLAIVSAIAEAHGGAVELVSAVGVGSTFTLVLPVDVRPADGQRHHPTTTPAHSREEQAWQPS